MIIIAPPAPSDAKKLPAPRSRLVAPEVPGSTGTPHALRQHARLHLVAEQLENLRPRADERDPFLGAAAGEVGVLAEEAVARMDRVAAGRLRDRDDLLDVEIGGGARCR